MNAKATSALYSLARGLKSCAQAIDELSAVFYSWADRRVKRMQFREAIKKMLSNAPKS
jgi:hypothetical protein